jgi:two-component system response regulator FixJ
MNSQPTVHVIDDEPRIRKGLQRLMESASLPVRVYNSAIEFLDNIDLKQPGCIVLDLRMPGMSGIELLQRLKEKGNHLPVIVISGHANVATAVQSMKLGAIDLLQKPFEPRALLDGIRRALETSRQALARRSEQEEIRRRFASLTSRELALLRLVVAGKSNKQIASDLNISMKTVGHHRAKIMLKTKALNGPDLVRMAMIADI